jgi:hypothetical protein
MAAVVSLEQPVFVEPSAGAELFAPANKKQVHGRGAKPEVPETHTLSPQQLSAWPPDLIVGRRRTVTPGLHSQSPAASTSVEQKSGSPVEHVVRRPEPSPLGYRFDVRQQWEGIVTSVDRDEFSVVLRDVIRRNAPEFEAVLSIEEISEDDLPLLKEGAVLYWTIGYKTRAGTTERVSTIRLRRLPAWSRSDLERVQRQAHELDEMFNTE